MGPREASQEEMIEEPRDTEGSRGHNEVTVSLEGIFQDAEGVGAVLR